MKAIRFRHQRGRQAGLSMIEVLVTLLIVSFGLLGVGALQMMSLQVNQGANQRTQAAILAASVIDSMRGNRSRTPQYARAYGAAAPSGTDIPNAEMGAIYSQVQSVLPVGDLQVQVTPRVSTAPGRVFYDVIVTVRWSESGRRLDQNEAAPATYTEFQLQTNV